MKHKIINGWTKDKMVEQIYLKNNGKKSTDTKNGNCVYETDDYNHCAVGCFIPDGHKVLISRWEGGAYYLFNTYPDLAPLMPLKDISLLEFQHIHDNNYDDSDIRLKLVKFINEECEE